MKVLLIGANGQLGSDLVPALEAWGAEGRFFRHSELDICNPTHVEEAVVALHPDFVINTAAFHKVEECEKNVEFSFRINVSRNHSHKIEILAARSVINRHRNDLKGG